MKKKDNCNEKIRVEKNALLFNHDFSAKLLSDHLIYNKVIKYIKNKRIPKSAFISVYYSNQFEVDTIAIIDWLLENHYRVCIPKIENKIKMVMIEIKNLEFDYEYCFNIKQPLHGDVIHKNQIKLFIVPIVAYDKCNYRLGHGSGFYDRYLSKCEDQVKIGLAYHFQEANKFAVNRWDIKLDGVITEEVNS